jgi:hypothetical protein
VISLADKKASKQALVELQTILKKSCEHTYAIFAKAQIR